MHQGLTADLVPTPRAAVQVVLNIVLVLAAAGAVAVLVLEFGFRPPLPVDLDLLHRAGLVIVAIFVLDRLARLFLARNRRAYMRDKLADFALMAAAAIAMIVAELLGHSGREIVSLGTFYVLITQVYLLASLLARGVSLNLRFAASGIAPPVLLAGSFLVLSLAGSGLLMLPTARVETAMALSYPEALFTAVSATCVTGLIVRDTGGDFTLFGQGVILALIQLGALGIMLFGTVLGMVGRRGLSLHSSGVLGEILSSSDVGRLRRTALFVVTSTLAVEAVGAAMLYPMFSASPGGAAPDAGKAVWDSVFHSISAFCNAGFSLYRDNLRTGVSEGWSVPLRDHWQVLGVLAPLIVLGGLGFPVLMDIARWTRDRASRLLRGRARRGAKARLTLHSRLVLTTTALLLIAGAGVLLAVQTSWDGLTPLNRAAQAMFQSVSARTAGFNTVDTAGFNSAAKFWMCGLMIIGGSPASAAGGMKTATFALLFVAVYCVMRRRDDLEVFHRSIPAQVLRRAVTVATLYMTLVGVIALLLCVTQPATTAFIDMLFESCSACGTVGLTTGVSGPGTSLNDAGKYILTAAMFVGRVGLLTLLLALTSGLRHADYSYPSETVIIG
ncbi:MAG: hypothetical protein LLG01_05510 [Planctomycetaceae bacterium]|nr:hypothetical protein [Planctomycetaceae bacterium]